MQTDTYFKSRATKAQRKRTVYKATLEAKAVIPHYDEAGRPCYGLGCHVPAGQK